MIAVMNWVNFTELDTAECFLLTKNLYDLEQVLETPSPDSLHGSRRYEYPWVFHNLSETFLGAVLDAGAGSTAFQFLLSRLCREVQSLDSDPVAIDWIKKALARYPSNVHPTLGDILAMPYPDNYFDAAMCISVLEHIGKDHVMNAIQQLIRVTKPGGIIAITLDVVLESTDKQVDLNDFKKIASWLKMEIPEPPLHRMTFKVEPYNFPFTVACIKIAK